MKEWTRKEVEKLKEYLEAGYSTAEIGRRLGFTKNAIVGKVHRLRARNMLWNVKIPKKKIVCTRSNKDKITYVDIRENLENSKKSKSVNENFEGLKIKLIDLHVDACVWPVSENKDGEFVFCGHKVVKNKSYCVKHCQEAYNIIEK